MNHKPDCVCRKRTVKVKLIVEYVVDVPESWTPEDIEFHRNEASWCADNLVGELQEIADNDKICLCSFAEFEFVSEATVEDEQDQRFKLTDD